jgi:hypothetical protein
MLNPDSAQNLARAILCHGYGTKSEIRLTRSTDLAAFADGPLAGEEMFIKVFRSLKLLAALNPWPAADVERSAIEIGIANEDGSDFRWFRFAVEFHSAKGGEEAVIAAPVACERGSK